MPWIGSLVFGADRREHAVRADECVDGQQPEVRRRVDDDLVVVVDDRLERVVEKALAAELSDETHLDAGELGGGRDHVDAVYGSDDRVCGARAAGEHVDQVDAERASFESELSGQSELRVRVDNEDAAAAARE